MASERMQDRIRRRVVVISEQMALETDPIKLARMNGALSMLTIAMAMQDDRNAQQLLDRARTLRAKD